MADALTTIEQVRTTAVDLALRFGPKLLVAIAIFAVGVAVSRWAARISLWSASALPEQRNPPSRQISLAAAGSWRRTTANDPHATTRDRTYPRLPSLHATSSVFSLLLVLRL
jgi:hypothetical protein